MPLTVAELNAVFTTDSSGLKTGIASAEKSLKSFANSMRDIGSGLTKHVTAPIIAAGYAILRAGQQAQRAENMVNLAFGKMANHITQWSRNTGTAIGLSEESVASFVSTAYTLNQSLEITASNSLIMAKNITTLTGDLSALLQLDPKEVFDALEGGVIGRTRGLIKLGITLKDTEILEKAVQMGLATSIKEVSEVAKAEARYQLILDKTGKVQGEYAKHSSDVANSLRSLKNELESVGKTIFLAIKPIIETALKSVHEFVKKLQELADKFKALPRRTQENIIKFIAMAAAIGPVLVAVFGLTGYLTSLAGVIATIGGTFLANPVLLVAIAAAVALLASHWREVRDFSLLAARGIQEVLDKLKPQLIEAFKQVWNNLKSAIDAVWQAMQTALNGLGIDKWTILKGVLKGLVEIVIALGEAFATMSAAIEMAAAAQMWLDAQSNMAHHPFDRAAVAKDNEQIAIATARYNDAVARRRTVGEALNNLRTSGDTAINDYAGTARRNEGMPGGTGNFNTSTNRYGQGSQWLQVEAARQAQYAIANSPVSLRVSGGRSYRAQAQLHAKKSNQAAAPGNSYHEAGLAIDINTIDLNKLRKKLGGQAQLDAYLARFGYVQPSWARARGSNPEPWHYEYQPITSRVSAQSAVTALRKTHPELGAGGSGSAGAGYIGGLSIGAGTSTQQATTLIDKLVAQRVDLHTAAGRLVQQIAPNNRALRLKLLQAVEPNMTRWRTDIGVGTLDTGSAISSMWGQMMDTVYPEGGKEADNSVIAKLTRGELGKKGDMHSAADVIMRTLGVAPEQQKLIREQLEKLYPSLINSMKTGATDWTGAVSTIEQAVRTQFETIEDNWSRLGENITKSLNKGFVDTKGLEVGSLLETTIQSLAEQSVQMEDLVAKYGKDFIKQLTDAASKDDWTTFDKLIADNLGGAVQEAKDKIEWDKALALKQEAIDKIKANFVKLGGEIATALSKGIDNSQLLDVGDMLDNTIASLASEAIRMEELGDKYGQDFLRALIAAAGNQAEIDRLIKEKIPNEVDNAINNLKLDAMFSKKGGFVGKAISVIDERARHSFEAVGEQLGADLAKGIGEGLQRELSTGDMIGSIVQDAVSRRMRLMANQGYLGKDVAKTMSDWQGAVAEIKDPALRNKAYQELAKWSAAQLAPLINTELNRQLIETLASMPASAWLPYGTTLIEQIMIGFKNGNVVASDAINLMWQQVQIEQSSSSQATEIIRGLGEDWWKKFLKEWNITGIEQMANLKSPAAWEALRKKMVEEAGKTGKASGEAFQRQMSVAFDLIQSGGKINGLGGFLSTIAKLFKGTTGDIISAVGGGLSSGGGLGSILGGIGMLFGPVGGVVGSLLGGIFGKGKKGPSQAELDQKAKMKQAGHEIVCSVIKGMVEQYPELAKATVDMWKTVDNAKSTGGLIGNLAGKTTDITAQLTGLTNGIAATFQIIRESVYKVLGISMAEEDKAIKANRAASEKIILSIIKGMEAKFPGLKDIAAKIREQVEGIMKTGWRDSADLTRRLGDPKLATSIMDELIKAVPGLARNRAYLEKALQDQLAIMMKQFGGVEIDPAAMPAIGAAIIQGLIEGMKGAEPKLEYVMEILSAVITEVLKNKLAITSPSKVFMGFGQNIITGLEHGIIRGIPRIKGVMGKLVGALALPAGGVVTAKRENLLAELIGVMRTKTNTTVIELDGQTIARKTVPLIPGILRAKGVMV